VSQALIKEAYYESLLNINTIHIIHHPPLTFIKIYTVRILENRVTFCQWVHQMEINNEFLSLILFTDEASFTNYGLANLHNMHYWLDENPHWLREVDHQRQWSVNVWCSIIGDKLIGLYFIDGTLNSIKYDNFIYNNLGILLEDVQLNICRVM